MRKSKPTNTFKRMLSKTFVTSESVLDVIATEVAYFNMDQKSENLADMLDNGLIDETQATDYKNIVVTEYINRIHNEALEFRPVTKTESKD